MTREQRYEHHVRLTATTSKPHFYPYGRGYGRRWCVHLPSTWRGDVDQWPAFEPQGVGEDPLRAGADAATGVSRGLYGSGTTRAQAGF